ncbi:MAG: tetratricopeptide repeat protein, partial [Cyclobacteriaceae bacterium]
MSQTDPDRVFATGVELMEHNEFGAAREAFSQFIKLTPSNLKSAEARYYEAFCAVNLYHGDGEKKIEDFVASNPDHPKAATAYFDLANFFYAEKNYGRASSYFSKVDFPTLSNDQHAIGRFHWGYSYFNQRKLDEALDQFNFIKALGGQYGPATSYYAGFIELGKEDYENALIDLKRAEQNKSYSLVVPQLIANVYYKQKKYDELIVYSKSLEGREGITNPEEISLLTAEAYFKKNEFARALEGDRKS